MIELPSGGSDTVTLPSLMGLPKERHILAGRNHGPFYTCVLNGKRVCVYITEYGETWGIDAWPETKNQKLYIAQTFAAAGYTYLITKVELCGELTLMALLYDLTSGGNGGDKRDHP